MGILGALIMKTTVMYLLIVFGCWFVLLNITTNTVVAQENQSGIDQCVACHSNLEGNLRLPAQEIPESVHGKWNLSCADCHGGDPTKPDSVEAKAEGTHYIGKPQMIDIPNFCGRCHSDPNEMRKYNPSLPTDQVQKYETSHHGKQLSSGNEHVAQCISCHGVHSILPAENPLSKVYPLNIPQTCGNCHSNEDTMSDSGLQTDQLEKYKNSVHGHALYDLGDIAGAPTCNDCHGNHGAAPPEVTSVANICGTCHIRNRELFAVSKHKKVFDELDMPECSTCHSYHKIKAVNDDMLSTGEESLCMECHDPDETAMIVGTAMRKMIVSLESGKNHAETLLQEAEQKGMLVDEGVFLLDKVREKLIDSRTYIHTFHIASVSESITEGSQSAAQAASIGQQAIGEYFVRRRGFAISTIILTCVALGLYLKIREIERVKT